ncbi:KAP family P-loop NTPase fold protein [Enterovirga sp. CN4-39]|uniref:KAP family P-loop NTPase fold protein n=1 Tax=Enterovirga sp. CN4-39 TaxID=3400910 RepID=UPI003C0C350C
MRLGDIPITKRSEDALNRNEFATTLAKSIDDLAVAKNGFVIGLIGGWGSGKTSLINLLSAALERFDLRRIDAAICTRDPSVSRLSDDELEAGAMALARIRSSISDLYDSSRDLSLWEHHNQFAQFTSWLGNEQEAALAQRYLHLEQRLPREARTIILRFSPWLIAGRGELAKGLFSDLARTLGISLGDDARLAFGDLLTRLSELAPAAGAGATALGLPFGPVITAGGSWAKGVSNRLTTGPTLDQIRERLRGILGRLDGRRLLVIVDDLDRLLPDEALEMTSLVKSIGDLPNVVYLLSYDVDRLANSITNAAKTDGREFLEKIVQYPINLPPLEEYDLLRLLEVELTSLFHSLPSAALKPDLGSAWYLVLRYYIRTPRAVSRLVNGFSVAWSGLHDHVDPTDLLLLETLRIHDPVVYNWVRDNLTDLVN